MSLDLLKSGDMWVVLAYLLITFLVGVWKATLRSETMDDYALACREFSLPVMVCTLCATYIGGGSTIGFVEQVYKVGIIIALPCLGDPINKLIIARYFIDRIKRFRKAITVGDVMGGYFGKGAQVTTGMASVLVSIGNIGAQISAMGSLMHFTLHVPFELAAIISAAILIAYSASGGVRAVTLTDAFQFVILIITVPMVCNLGLVKLNGYLNLYSKVPAAYYGLELSERSLWGYIALFIAFSLPFFRPEVFQRIMMMKSADLGKQAFKISALLDLPFYFIVTITGLVAVVMVPQGEPLLAMFYLINNFLPDGMRGFVISGMVAVIMSTADSILNATSVSFAHDIVKPMWPRLSERQEILMAKITTVFIGTFAIIVAVRFKSILEIVIASLNLWGPVVVVPFYAAVFDIRAPRRSFYYSAIIGLGTAAVWNYYDIYQLTGIDSMFPALMANALCFFITKQLYAHQPLPPVTIYQQMEDRDEDFIEWLETVQR